MGVTEDIDERIKIDYFLIGNQNDILNTDQAVSDLVLIPQHLLLPPPALPKPKVILLIHHPHQISITNHP